MVREDYGKVREWTDEELQTARADVENKDNWTARDMGIITLLDTELARRHPPKPAPKQPSLFDHPGGDNVYPTILSDSVPPKKASFEEEYRQKRQK